MTGGFGRDTDQVTDDTTGKGGLYVKRLDDVDADVLARLIERGWITNHRSAES